MRLSEGIGRMLDYYRNISQIIVHVPETEKLELASEWFEKQYRFRLGAKLSEFEQDFGYPGKKTDPGDRRKRLWNMEFRF